MHEVLEYYKANLEYYKAHPLEKIIRYSIGGLEDDSTLEEIRDVLDDLVELAIKQDPVSQELLRQIAARELKAKFKLPQASKLIEAAFKNVGEPDGE